MTGLVYDRAMGMSESVARWATMGCVAVAAALWVFYTRGEAFPLDDAFIVQHSVHGMLSGGEARFMGSAPGDGVTSPLYALLVALLAWALPVPIAHALVSALCMVALAAAFVEMGRRHLMVAWAQPLLAAGGLTAGLTISQLANGLETGMAMATVAWAIVAFDRTSPVPRWGLALLSALPFIRPELAALSGALALFALSQAVNRTRGALTTLAISGAAFAGVVWLVFGSLVSTTAEAKAMFFAEACLPLGVKWRVALGAVEGFVAALGIASVGFLLVARSRLWPVALIFGCAFFAAYLLTLPGALHHNHYRYLYLLAPFALLGWATCLCDRIEWVRRTAQVTGVLALLLSIASAPSALRAHAAEVERHSTDNREMAAWVSANVPHDAVVLVHDAGAVSLYGSQPLIDLVGLKSPFSIVVHRETTAAACGRVPLAVSAIAMQGNAEYLVVTQDWDQFFRITESLRVTGWSVNRADVERGETFYRVYAITRPSRRN